MPIAFSRVDTERPISCSTSIAGVSFPTTPIEHDECLQVSVLTAAARSTMTRLALGIFAALLLSAPAHAAWRSEGPFVGVVVDVAVDPANPNIIYAATHSGGVWRS